MAGSTGLLMKGLSKTLGGMDMSQEKIRKAYSKALTMEAEELMAESQEQVPVDKGFLKNSKFVKTHFTAKRGDIRIVLGYDIEYATEVHNTNKNYRHGKWKYLTDPLQSRSSGFYARMAQRIRLFT